MIVSITSCDINMLRDSKSKIIAAMAKMVTYGFPQWLCSHDILQTAVLREANPFHEDIEKIKIRRQWEKATEGSCLFSEWRVDREDL